MLVYRFLKIAAFVFPLKSVLAQKLLWTRFVGNKLPKIIVPHSGDNNAGLRVLYEDDDVALLWKTSNVAMTENENAGMRRAASKPLPQWCRSGLTPSTSRDQLECAVVSPLFSSFVSTSTSGMVLVTKTQSATEEFRTLSDTSAFIYAAVVSLPVSIKESMAGAPLLEDNNSVHKKDKDKEIVYQQVDESGTHGRLALLRIQCTLSSTTTSSTVNDILRHLEELKTPCIYDGKSPMISFIGFDIYPARADTSSSTSAVEGLGGGLSVELDVPPKFLKYLRREKLLYERKNALFSTTTTSSTSSHQQQEVKGAAVVVDNDQQSGELVSVVFMGKSFLVPASMALKPRESSAPLVETAVIHLRTVIDAESAAASGPKEGGRRQLRVLDLGCGTGALLLSVLDRTTADIDTTSTLNTDIVVGVGVDLDTQALSVAQLNAANNANEDAANEIPVVEEEKKVAATTTNSDSRSSGEEGKRRLERKKRSKWLRGDFGKLHDPEIFNGLQQAVAELSSSIVVTRDDGLFPSDVGPSLSAVANSRDDGLFDVILCNPPFLSAKAAAGRVTEEGKHVLVGGETGLEPYIAICKSIIAAEHDDIAPIAASTTDSIKTAPIAAAKNDKDSSSEVWPTAAGAAGGTTIMIGGAAASAPAAAAGLLARRRRKAAAAIQRQLQPQEQETILPYTTAITLTTTEPSVSGKGGTAASGGQHHLKPTLLKHDGIVIFQVPGGETGADRVRKVVEPIGFEVINVVKDSRGVNRAIVLRRRAKSSSSKATTRVGKVGSPPVNPPVKES